jgi:hypothetical protein
MASAKFIHIGFIFTGPPPIEALEKVFQGALDWLRYEPHCWIIYTTTDIDTWRNRIHNTAGIQTLDSFFMCEFERNSVYMHQWVWDWVGKDRSPG